MSTKSEQVIQAGMDAVDSLRVRKLLIGIYRQWRNDYLTIDTFAEHNELSIDQAEMLIRMGKEFDK